MSQRERIFVPVKEINASKQTIIDPNKIIGLFTVKYHSDSISLTVLIAYRLVPEVLNGHIH